MKLLRDERGASAVEFAIISPLLILFLLTTVYLGIYLSVVHSVQQLAADGARVSVAGFDDNERRGLTTSYIEAAAPRYFLIAGAGVDVGYAEQNQAVEVTVSYDASPLLAWYPASFMPLLGTTVTRTAVVRTGGF
jgi:Flp pilus assembly protein TadG